MATESTSGVSNRAWWLLAATVSVASIAALVGLWSHMNRHEVIPVSTCEGPDGSDIVSSGQLTDATVARRYLDENWVKRLPALGVGSPPVEIPTGIFIQSLKFFNSSEVNLTGYIWQRFADGLHDHVVPARDEIGFILPEQVDSNVAPREAYRYRRGGWQVVGWYFEATLRQPFVYFDYPFDHKTVWVRLWPQQFSDNIVLVPDFKAYDERTGPTDIFGIEHAIVLGAWQRTNTFFDYKPTSYDTNFGIDGYIGQNCFPELHYNFVIQRRFGNAFIVHLLPLFLVAALLYGALLTISDDETVASRHGFSTSGVIGTCSALFFVVLLAHIQLREQFAGARVVYMEFFYFLMYGVLVTAAAYTFVFATKPGRMSRYMHYRDNLIVRAGYWPFLLVCMVAITVVFVLAR